MNCENCGGSGWIVTERGARACKCRALRAARSLPFTERGIALTHEAAIGCVRALCELLAFAPGDFGQAIIVAAVSEMCSTQDELEYTVRVAGELYTKWEDCGIPGLRQIVSSFRVPKDGKTLLSTAAYPEGLPSSKPLESPPLLALPPGHVATADPQLDQEVKLALVAMPQFPSPRPMSLEESKRARQFDKLLKEIITGPEDRPAAPLPKKRRHSSVVRLSDDRENEPRPEGTYKRFTAEEVEEAYRKHKEEQRRKESA